MTLQRLETAAQSCDLYLLDATGRVVPCANPLDWLGWMRSNPRVVEATLLPNNREIVTLFAGYAGEANEKLASTFCSIVKPEPGMPEYAIALRWYVTRAAAEAGHNDLVEQFKSR